jgi:hypothetical protein
MCPTTIHKQNDSQNKAYGENVHKTDSCNERNQTQNDKYNNAATTKQNSGVILCLKCDGTFAETKFHLSAKRTSAFKSAGASVQLTTGSRGVLH